jgi:hypothetical protein
MDWLSRPRFLRRSGFFIADQKVAEVSYTDLSIRFLSRRYRTRPSRGGSVVRRSHMPEI